MEAWRYGGMDGWMHFKYNYSRYNVDVHFVRYYFDSLAAICWRAAAGSASKSYRGKSYVYPTSKTEKKL